MRAFLIDPVIRTIAEFDTPGGLQDLYSQMDCSTVTAVELTTERDTLWLDDEGLINGVPPYLFTVGGFADPFFGKAVVTGCDDEGAMASTTLRLDRLMANITFYEVLVGRTAFQYAPNAPGLAPLGHSDIAAITAPATFK